MDTNIFNMSPSGSGGGSSSGGPNNPGGGNNSGGGNNPGGWSPFHYVPGVREDGTFYPVDSPSPSLVLQTYNPAGDVPVKNDKELGVLIDFRYHHGVRAMGYSNWRISNVFPSDSMVDRIAKERLLAHIYDHRSELSSAYAQMDMLSGRPKWESVKITSYLITSLNYSNN